MNRINISWKRAALALAVFIASVLYFTWPRLTQTARPNNAVATLTDLANIDPLRDQFNRDAGATRLIMLVSPT